MRPPSSPRATLGTAITARKFADHGKLSSNPSDQSHKGMEGFGRKVAGYIFSLVTGYQSLLFTEKRSRIVDGRFRDHYQYSIRVNNKVLPMKDWEEVLREFDDWLLKVGA